MNNYIEIKPVCSTLEAIDCFWLFEPGTQSLTELHTVTPDNRVDILFDDEGNAVFSGPMSTYFTTKNRKIFGIRFRPEYIYSLFNIPLSEFTDKTVELNLFFKDSGLFAELKNLSPSFGSFINTFQNYFQINANTFSADPRVRLLTRSLEKGLSLRELKNQIGVSEQHLRRLCQKNLGISPKKFEKIERFKNIKNKNKKPSNKMDLAQMALAHGYFDQSHFINECKQLTGTTPKLFFS